MSHHSKLEIISGRNERTGVKEHRWHVKAGNGEIVASGEGYTSKADAKRGFEDAHQAMTDAARAYNGSEPESAETGVGTEHPHGGPH